MIGIYFSGNACAFGHYVRLTKKFCWLKKFFSRITKQEPTKYFCGPKKYLVDPTEWFCFFRVEIH